MKTVLTIFLATCVMLGASAQGAWNQRYLDYISRYKDVAVQEMLRYQIPASITLAQGILESAAGQSELCRKGNNHFGIKCHGWSGATVYHDDDETQECFRAYDTALESFEDHSRFLASGSRYRSLFSLPVTDYRGWARGLSQCGYATNPHYAESLISLIELYRLDQYDRKSDYVVMPTTGGSVTSKGLHHIYIYNKNYYLRARRGDTFKSLAIETGISARKLARHNERHRSDQLNEGDIVYLKKKQKRALKAFKKKPHQVAVGESLYDISQAYGIRLKSLYKKNHLADDYVPRVGDRLKVY